MQRPASHLTAPLREPRRRTPAKRLTLKTALGAYVRWLEAEGKASAKQAQNLADKVLGTGTFVTAGRFRLPSGMALTSLSMADLAALREARRLEGNSTQTIAHELKLLRAATMHAGLSGHAAPVLRWNIPVPKLKTRWLTVPEWRLAFDALDPHRPIPRRQSKRKDALHKAPGAPYAQVIAARQQAQDLFIALTLCGGRWSEVARLTTDQILPHGVRLWGYKTQTERLVPTPPMMVTALQRRAAQARELGTPFLFPGRWEGARKSSVIIRQAMTAAGLNAPELVARNGRATVHSLRHSFASWLLQAGMNLAEVQELLGHQTIEMTRRYAHLTAGVTVAKASAKLAELFALPS